MKPPWIDQGWSMVAGALANRGVHPPPTTSRPSLPSRCGCTPDCLRSPRPAATPLAGFQSLSLPLPRRARKRVARLPAKHPARPVRSLARSRARALSSPFLPYRVLRSRPPTRPTPPVNGDDALPHPLGVDTENRRRPRACSRRLSYAATAITFAGKSSGAAGKPGLTLQGAVCVRPR